MIFKLLLTILCIQVCLGTPTTSKNKLLFATGFDSKSLTSEDESTEFFYALCTEEKVLLQCIVFSTTVRANSTSSDDKYVCNIRLWGGEGPDDEKRHVEIDSLAHYGDGRLVFKWYELEEDIVVRAMYTMLETKTINKAVLFFPIGLSRSDPLYINEFVLTDAKDEDWNLSLFTSSKSICEGLERCVLDYVLNLIKPLNFKLQNAKVWMSRNEDFTFIRGSDPITKQSVIIKKKEDGGNVTEILSVDQKVQLITTNTTYGHGYVACYLDATEENANCIQFDENAELKLNKSINFLEPIRLVSIHIIDNGFILFVEPKNCIDDACWHNLQYATVEKDKPSGIHEENFNCTGDRRKLSLYSFRLPNKWNLVYLCKSKDQPKAYVNVGSVRVDGH